MEADLSADIEALCARQLERRPTWVVGSISRDDANFLATRLVGSGERHAVEIGTASGFSTAVMAEALALAERARRIESPSVASFDLQEHFYADPTRRVGDAARAILSDDLLGTITFHTRVTSADIRDHYAPDTINFLFLDANHSHPWPALDLLLLLESLACGATVVLHDVNLPLIAPQFDAWGVKYVFDELDLDKGVPRTNGAPPNIGAITIPDDKPDLREQLLGILHRHDWQVQPWPEIIERATGAHGR